MTSFRSGHGWPGSDTATNYSQIWLKFLENETAFQESTDPVWSGKLTGVVHYTAINAYSCHVPCLTVCVSVSARRLWQKRLIISVLGHCTVYALRVVSDFTVTAWCWQKQYKFVVSDPYGFDCCQRCEWFCLLLAMRLSLLLVLWLTRVMWLLSVLWLIQVTVVSDVKCDLPGIMPRTAAMQHLLAGQNNRKYVTHFCS